MRLTLAPIVLVPLWGFACATEPSREPEQPASASPPPSVTLYGRTGSFGDVALPGVHTVGVTGWATEPGQMLLFTAAAADGSLIIANEPQTDNQVLATAANMALTVFYPGTTPRLENVVVPTTTGATVATGRTYDRVGGADIADVQWMVFDGAPRIAFISAVPYHNWDVATTGLYPELGFLVRGADGNWGYDAAHSRTAVDLAAASPLGAQACRQVTGIPTITCQAPAEMALLPHSNNLVISHYAGDPIGVRSSGRLSIVDPAGIVRATYALPEIRDLTDGAILQVAPREVDADPTSALGDERFVVIFDTFLYDPTPGATPVQRPFALQEFSYDANAQRLRPVTDPILTGDRDAAGNQAHFSTAQYDHAGNLWATQGFTGTSGRGTIAVYTRGGDGRRSLETRCAVTYGWNSRWARTCAPDLRLAAGPGVGLTSTLVEDTRTGDMITAVTAGDGTLQIYRPAYATTGTAPIMVSATFTQLPLPISGLPRATTETISMRKGSFIPSSEILYLPINHGLRRSAPCALKGANCPPAELDQWLWGLDIGAIARAATWSDAVVR